MVYNIYQYTCVTVIIIVKSCVATHNPLTNIKASCALSFMYVRKRVSLNTQNNNTDYQKERLRKVWDFLSIKEITKRRRLKRRTSIGGVASKHGSRLVFLPSLEMW